MAMNGFLQSGVCYSDINSAYNAYVQTITLPPKTFISDAYLDYWNVSWGGLKGHYFIQYSSIDPVTHLVSLVSRFFIDMPFVPACDPIQPFLDGTFLGFTVAGAVITVSLLAVLRRAL